MLQFFLCYSHPGGITIGRRQHKPYYYWTVQWCRKVEQSGWPIAGWPAVLSQLSQSSHLSLKIGWLLYDATQLSPTGCQPSQWTFLHQNTALMLPPPYYYTSMYSSVGIWVPRKWLQDKYLVYNIFYLYREIFKFPMQNLPYFCLFILYME